MNQEEDNVSSVLLYQLDYQLSYYDGKGPTLSVVGDFKSISMLYNQIIKQTNQELLPYTSGAVIKALVRGNQKNSEIIYEFGTFEDENSC